MADLIAKSVSTLFTNHYSYKIVMFEKTLVCFSLQMRLNALKQILALLHTGENPSPAAVLEDGCGSTLNLQSLLLSAQLQLLLGTLGPEVLRPSSQGESEGCLLLHYQVYNNSMVLTLLLIWNFVTCTL